MQQDALERITDGLYALPPEEFVPARDDEASAARERGERDLARAISRLRRPTRAAWLANLLARNRADQLDGLIALAAGLTEAQRTLDGAQLRALSSQRHRAVAAMAREAGRLAQQAGSPATQGQLRELQEILEAALAQPDAAREVRSGRLTRTLRYTGFGPDTETDAVPLAAPLPLPRPRERRAPQPTAAEPDAAARRREAERAELRRALADAEEEAAAAQECLDAAEAAHDDTRRRHADAHRRVSEIAAELDDAREVEQRAADAERAAAGASRDAARAASAATARAARARARLDALSEPGS